MCWNGDIRSSCIATEDITVYKVVNPISQTKCTSFYQKYPYIKGELRCTIIYHKCTNLLDTNEIRIENGFHAYSDISMFLTSGELTVVHPLHDKSTSLDTFWCGERIAKFIIPKGSTFYKNRKGEVVSNQIIFDSYVLGNF